jgi:hypothetical protein
VSSWHPHYDEDLGLNSTETVYELKEKKNSKLLDKDGNPIPYQSKKLGYMGFYPLREKP